MAAATAPGGGVTVSREVIAGVLALAALHPSAEVCGLLLGAADRIEAMVPTANVAADIAVAFEIDPAALLTAHRAARRGGPQVVGNYHSHPSGSASPSARDAAAAEPGALWLIAGGGGLRLWRAGASGFRELAIVPA